MSAQAPAALTPGATRAGPGSYLFEMAKQKHIVPGDYSTTNGYCVEGDRIMVGLMRMPNGTGADLHSHPNEQWMFIMEGEFEAQIDGVPVHGKPGSVIYIPANAIHGGKAKGDLVFFTCKDTSHQLGGISLPKKA